MDTLVIYDSLYGNTQKVAKAIAGELKGKTLHINKAKLKNVKDSELLVFGTPVHGGRFSENTKRFVSTLSPDIIKDKKIAVFDTRMDVDDQSFGLKLLMKTIGFAAGKLAKDLSERGAKIIGDPQGFFVEGKEGPLKKGELIRAKEWSVSLLGEL